VLVLLIGFSKNVQKNSTIRFGLRQHPMSAASSDKYQAAKQERKSTEQ
jgi:hypothetical protein